MKSLRSEIRIRSAFAALAALAALFAAASCEKEIEFKGDETTPRLVLYSLSTPGQKLSADVSSSVFFLKQNYDNKLFTSTLDTLKGGLKVYVNGSATPYVMRYTPLEDDYYSSSWKAPTLHYETDYIPSEGDRIRIVAEFPGFETAEGETRTANKLQVPYLLVYTKGLEDEYAHFIPISAYVEKMFTLDETRDDYIYREDNNKAYTEGVAEVFAAYAALTAGE